MAPPYTVPAKCHYVKPNVRYLSFSCFTLMSGPHPHAFAQALALMTATLVRLNNYVLYYTTFFTCKISFLDIGNAKVTEPFVTAEMHKGSFNLDRDISGVKKLGVTGTR